MANVEGQGNNLFREGDRVFATMDEKPCPLGCLYCFVEAPGYKPVGNVGNQEGVSTLKYEVEETDGVRILLPAHDIELFRVKDWYPKLLALTDLGLDTIVATKSSLKDKQVAQLVEVDKKLAEKGALLQIGVSIPRLDAESTRAIELYTQPPEKRIATAQRLYEAGIATNIAIRPTLPFVPDEEYEELIQRTAPFCDSYLTSPLYLTPKMTAYMDEHHPGYAVEIFSPSFMQGTPEIRTVNTDATSAKIAQMAARHSKPCFDSATPSIQLAHAQRNRADLSRAGYTSSR